MENLCITIIVKVLGGYYGWWIFSRLPHDHRFFHLRVDEVYVNALPQINWEELAKTNQNQIIGL